MIPAIPPLFCLGRCTLGRGPKQRNNPTLMMRMGPPSVAARVEDLSSIDSEDICPFTLHICLHKTCKSQGADINYSFAQAFTEIPSVTFKESGCLGNCGSGPNVLLEKHKTSSERGIITGLKSPAHVLYVLEKRCNFVPDPRTIEASHLRVQANQAARIGDKSLALDLYDRAVATNPSHGVHLILANRSTLKLLNGDASGAAQDAEKAVATAANSDEKWFRGYLKLASACAALGKKNEAQQALQNAVNIDRSAKNDPEYQAVQKQI